MATSPYRYSAYSNIRNETDPRKAAAQDRIFAYDRGQELDAAFGADQDVANFERDAYGQRLRGVYDPMIAGQGGLTPEQMAQVTREGDLSNLGMTPDEISQSYLNPQEQEAIMGNPANRSRYFNPNRENDLFNEGAQRQRTAVNEYGEALNNAFDPNALRPNERYVNELGGQLSNYESSLNTALDPSGLTVSDQFLKDYQFSPEQQQNAITAAANVVGTRDKAAVDEMQRRARAAGTNPLGVAAMQQRMTRESNANAADAATAAKVGVNSEAARRMQVGEQMRLDSGRNLAGMRMDAAGNIIDARFRGANTVEGARVGAERDIADRRTTAADRGYGARVDSETDLGRRGLDLQQSISQRGNEIERDSDDTAVARNTYLADNRQGADRYVQGQRYDRGMAGSDRLADRYRYATDAARGDAQEGRGYYREAGAQANQNYNTAGDRRAQLYNSQMQGGQGATRTQAQIDEAERNRPKLWEKLVGAGSRAAGAYFTGGLSEVARAGGGWAKGGVVTQPTYALIGESGPEMVIPLDAEQPMVLPSMVAQPGQPLPFQTAPPPARMQSAYSTQYRYAR